LISVDTNVLVYAVDRDAGDRHSRAAELLERLIRAAVCTQPLQTLSEFFNASTRKLGIEPAIAAEFVEGWRTVIPVEPASADDLSDAIRGVREHGLSFWDAMLWATVRRTGIRLLLSEDFQDGRIIEGVRIANPFEPSNGPMIERTLAR